MFSATLSSMELYQLLHRKIPTGAFEE